MHRLLLALVALILTTAPALAGTRAVQVESLLSGLRDSSGKLLTGGKVYTYTAGTTTPATVWTDANKATPAANPVTLDAAGKVSVFADGLYKFVVKTSTGATVATWDGLKYRYPNSSVVTKISNYAATYDDDVILVDAAAGPITITLPSATAAVYPLVVKKIDATGNTVTIAASGGQTIDGAATIAIAVQNGTATLYSDGSQWRGASQVVTAGDSDKLDGYHAANTTGAIPISNGIVNTNLNADLLDGQTGSFYQSATNLTAGTLDLARIPTTLTGKDADTLDGNHSTALSPPGAVTAFAGSTAPTGWLECNGAAVSRSTYASLYSVIGTTYGAGDGSTTFNLPDLRGEFIRGWAHDRTVDTGRAIGSSQGDQLQTHEHALWNPRNSTWATADDYGPGSGNLAGQDTVTDPGSSTITSTVFRAKDITVGSSGAETRPRNVALMYIIKY